MRRFQAYLRSNPPARLLFVDDGSQDQTSSLIEEIRAGAPVHCDVLRLAHNHGKGEAVRLGIVRALQGSPPPRYVGFWDADLSTPLEAIAGFVDFAERHPHVEMLLGSRVRLLGRRIERQAIRHYMGRVVATAISVVLSLGVYDTQCGAKLFRVDDPVRGLFSTPFLTRWLFDVEILARWIQASRRQGGRPVEDVACEIPLLEWSHVGGGKVTPLDFFRAGLDLVRIGRAYLW